MAHLIDRDALAAEIENIRKHYIEKEEFDIGWNFALDKILSFIDTLEVKEVDLEKEIKEQTDIYYNMCEEKLKEMSDDDTDLSFLTLDSYAKHFFELGLKTQKGE